MLFDKEHHINTEFKFLLNLSYVHLYIKHSYFAFSIRLGTFANNYPCRLWRMSFGYFLILFLFDSCKLASDFPLTINDIDTLTVYKEHQPDSTSNQKAISAAKPDSTDSVNTIPKIENQIKQSSPTSRSWSICAGVFKNRNNAERMFGQLNHYENTFLIVRDSTYFVSIGSFDSRDSAILFQTSKALTGTYIMKLRANEQLLNPAK